MEWRRYWSEERVKEFFKIHCINSISDLKRMSRDKSLPPGIPTKNYSFLKHYGKEMHEFYPDAFGIHKKPDFYKEEELRNKIKYYIVKHGIYRSEELMKIRLISNDPRIPIDIQGSLGSLCSQILKDFKIKNIATIEQCVNLKNNMGITSNEEWNNIIANLNNEELTYPCNPCEYFFNSRNSTPDKETSIEKKEILLLLSDKLEVHKKLCYGNKEDVRYWMIENKILSIETEYRKKNNEEFRNSLPYWIPGSPCSYYGVKASYFQPNVDKIKKGEFRKSRIDNSEDFFRNLKEEILKKIEGKNLRSISSIVKHLESINFPHEISNQASWWRESFGENIEEVFNINSTVSQKEFYTKNITKVKHMIEEGKSLSFISNFFGFKSPHALSSFVKEHSLVEKTNDWSKINRKLWEGKSEEEIKKHSQRTKENNKKRWSSYTDGEKSKIGQKISEGLQKSFN